MHKRKKRLVKPGLQLRLVGSFVGVAVLAMVLQFLFLGYFLTRAAAGIDGMGGQIAAEVPGVLLTVLGVSLVVLVPIFVVFGVLMTHRLAGPVYRFEQYLSSVAKGEADAPCRLRQGDELQSLCDAINTVTEPLLTSRSEESAADTELRSAA